MTNTFFHNENKCALEAVNIRHRYTAFRLVGGEDAPFRGVEVVGSIPKIFHKSEWAAIVCKQNISTRSVVNRYRLSPQIRYRCIVINIT